MDMQTSVWVAPLAVGVVALVAIVRYEWLWRMRGLLAQAVAGLLATGLLFVWFVPLPLLARVLLFTAQAWFVVLALRLSFGRLDALLLRVTTPAAGLMGLGIVALISLLAAAPINWALVVVCAVAVGAVLFLWQIGWSLRHFATGQTRAAAGRELPTVSVCIPARNETHALAECLATVLRSDYPKLEVLVLDDCSQDATADIIKSFAHAGVRFVQGHVPASSWIGKNQAMHTLADHASGDYLLYISVDTQLSPQSVTQLVNYAQKYNAAMVSVLPQYRLGARLSTVLATLHTFWQLALPLTKRRVPVSTKSWLIRADALRALGGFGSVKQKIIPEGSFARRLFTTSAYRFVVSSPGGLGLTTAKLWQSQVNTALRILYPTCRRQPFIVLLAVGAIASLLAPFWFGILGAVKGNFDELFWVSTAASGLLVLGYGVVLSHSHPRSWGIDMLFLPIVLVQEIILLVMSMLAYEFSEVTWKGRNVCYPVPPRAGRR